MPIFVHMAGKRTKQKHLFVEEVASTNRTLWQMLDAGQALEEPFVLQAAWQSEGRGLGDNAWHSEKGQNLLFSLLLEPKFLDPAEQFLLNQCVALGVRQALSDLCPRQPFVVKWPNDIYAGQQKIAGMLIENRLMGKSYELAIVGVGVNINQESFPPFPQRAVSLRMVSGQAYDIRKSLDACLSRILSLYNDLAEGKRGLIRQTYEKHLLGFGQRRRFRDQNGHFQGIIRGVDRQGMLIIERPGGQRQHYDMKRIRFLEQKT